jgi:hypothetical protein
VKRALLLLALCAACAQQDPALLVTMSGPFRIPADGDKLVLDVFTTDASKTPLGHKTWCANTTPGCDVLPVQPALNGSITLVQSGASHPQVKINVELFLGSAVVGLGTVTADFQSGRTVEVPIPLTHP